MGRSAAENGRKFACACATPRIFAAECCSRSSPRGRVRIGVGYHAAASPCHSGAHARRGGAANKEGYNSYGAAARAGISRGRRVLDPRGTHSGVK